MRNRQQTIQALERFIERPGTPEEGETARRLLEKMQGENPARPEDGVGSCWWAGFEDYA
jgi:hypothetical protein